MANENLPQTEININDPRFLITETFNGKPAIISTEIAKHFNKQHQHVLRDIGTLKGMVPPEFGNANFGKIFIKDIKGEKRPAWLLTRDAFSLFVMGMTGKTAVMWKLRYIEAFNALEKAFFENQALIAREAGYLEGRQDALGAAQNGAQVKAAYLDGIREGRKIQKKADRLASLEKIWRYKKLGLKYSEMAKILGLSADAIASRVKRARKSGFWPEANISQKPEQCTLIGEDK